VDLATHALTSLALARGFFPRRSWRFVAGVVLAGTLADADLLTLLFGPGAYLSGRLTATHSLAGTVLVVAVAAAFCVVVRPKNGPPQKAGPTNPGLGTILLAALLAAVVHLLMDLATSCGVALLWPFRATRFAGDFLPEIDPWILALLLAGILLPELFRLVGSEIGAKEKAPRGRNGAIVALALVQIYVGGRAILHGNGVAQLGAHSYRGESPRQAAAFPDSLSLVTWHGVVETASQICTADVPAAGTGRFDRKARRAYTSRKNPRRSPLLRKPGLRRISCRPRGSPRPSSVPPPTASK
jgi:membrane-bound metal-dependent hydrolase YbcI (DUF457 family)